MFKSGRDLGGAYAILIGMKGGKNNRGFTIMETLIVLAVTGVLFTAIAVTLSGRQSKAEFEQSIHEIQSQLQQTISEVGTGNFPSTANLTCSATGSGVSFAPGATAQGENSGCVFLGKVVQFKVAGSGDSENFNIYTAAGMRRTTAQNEVTSYAEAQPALIPASFSGAVENKRLLYGLNTYSMKDIATGTDVGAIAFLSSMASYTGDSIVAGTQQVRTLAVKGVGTNLTDTQAIAAANDYLQAKSGYTPDADASNSQGVAICFVSGGTEQSGLVIIGGANRQLSVTLTIKGNKTCA